FFDVEAFAAVLSVEAFEVGVCAVVLTLLAFAADFVVMGFAAAAFMTVAFAAGGSTIAASTMGSSSVVLVTRSFPTHTTGTIPIAIIRAITLMVMDTVALAIILMGTDTAGLLRAGLRGGGCSVRTVAS